MGTIQISLIICCTLDLMVILNPSTGDVTCRMCQVYDWGRRSWEICTFVVAATLVAAQLGLRSQRSQRSPFKLQGAPDGDIAPSIRTILDIKAVLPWKVKPHCTRVQMLPMWMITVLDECIKWVASPWAMAFGDTVITPYSSARLSNHIVVLIKRLRWNILTGLHTNRGDVDFVHGLPYSVMLPLLVQ